MSKQQQRRQQKEYFTFTEEDLRFIQVAIALAVGNEDIREMPRTKIALYVLSEKVDRIYHREVNEY
jgi:hypothetical protein